MLDGHLLAADQWKGADGDLAPDCIQEWHRLGHPSIYASRLRAGPDRGLCRAHPTSTSYGTAMYLPCTCTCCGVLSCKLPASLLQVSCKCATPSSLPGPFRNSGRHNEAQGLVLVPVSSIGGLGSSLISGSSLTATLALAQCVWPASLFPSLALSMSSMPEPTTAR